VIEIDVSYVIELTIGAELEITIVHSETAPVSLAIID